MTHTWTRWNGEQIRIQYTGLVRTTITFAKLLQQLGEEKKWYQVDYYELDEQGEHVQRCLSFPRKAFV